MIQSAYTFKSNSFIMAYHLLKEKKPHWVVRDFFNYGISKRLVAAFYNYLIKENVVTREKLLGPGSGCQIKDRGKLLTLCINGFVRPEKKIISFTSKRDRKALLEDLKKTSIPFYLGKFSSTSREFPFVQNENLYLYALDKGLFRYENLYKLEKQLGLYRVYHGGDIFLMLPRYRKFISHALRMDAGFCIPTDFYTYLDMMTMKNPRGREQAEYMYMKLKERGNSFV